MSGQFAPSKKAAHIDITKPLDFTVQGARRGGMKEHPSR